MIIKKKHLIVGGITLLVSLGGCLFFILNKNRALEGIVYERHQGQIHNDEGGYYDIVEITSEPGMAKDIWRVSMIAQKPYAGAKELEVIEEWSYRNAEAHFMRQVSGPTQKDFPSSQYILGNGNVASDLESRVYEHYNGKVQIVKEKEKYYHQPEVKTWDIMEIKAEPGKLKDIWKVTMKYGDGLNTLGEAIEEWGFRDGKAKLIKSVRR